MKQILGKHEFEDDNKAETIMARDCANREWNSSSHDKIMPKLGVKYVETLQNCDIAAQINLKSYT
jgi:hypothetical protein